VLCAERVVGNEPFASLLADDFITDDGKGITSDLIKGYEKNGKSEFSQLVLQGKFSLRMLLMCRQKITWLRQYY
jgi:UTP--glucose-1-phosphate uridylyltransferase